MGSMLDPPVGWDDFRLKDDRGRIMAEPRVAMLMEELAKVKNEYEESSWYTPDLCFCFYGNCGNHSLTA